MAAPDGVSVAAITTTIIVDGDAVGAISGRVSSAASSAVRSMMRL